MANLPTRDTSEQELDQWNRAMRASPGYQSYMRSIGKPTNGNVKLSRGEQAGLERVLAQAGIPIQGGMHIDQGGNLNQKNRLVRNVAIGAGITAATLATAGAAGFGPLAGVMGGASTAAPAAVIPAATTGGGTVAATGGGIAGTLGTINKVVNAGQGIAGLIQGVNNAVHGGITPADRGIAAGTAADQAARNRLLESQIAQNGPAVDATALANVQRAGRLANYTPPSASAQALFDKYGKRLPGVDATTMGFASGMQKELERRRAAGEPLTLSGVKAASAQELADSEAARKAALNPNGSGVMGAINTGAQIAGLAPGFLNLLDTFRPKKPDQV